VRFLRNRRARHYILRVDPDDMIRLTIPRGGSRAEACAFLRRQLRWIVSQRYVTARNAGSVFFRGLLLPLEVDSAGPTRSVMLGTERVLVGPGEQAKVAVCRRLREIAARELPARLNELAEALSLQVGGVAVRNQSTRWGSCSPGGEISLNWRLVQMPENVRDYILIHELVHLREPSHSRRFWQLVEQHCPHHRASRKWLEAHEAELR
jgi:predicted metal-dependent hydrolase